MTSCIPDWFHRQRANRAGVLAFAPQSGEKPGIIFRIKQLNCDLTSESVEEARLKAEAWDVAKEKDRRVVTACQGKAEEQNNGRANNF